MNDSVKTINTPSFTQNAKNTLFQTGVGRERKSFSQKENDKLIVQVWSRQSFYFLIKPRMEVIWKQLHLQATVHYQITVWIKREGHRRQPRDRVLQKSSSVSVLPRSSNNVIIVIGQTET